MDFDPRWETEYDVNLAVYAEFACDIQIATRSEVVAFTGNPNVQWNPPQDSSHSWNNMGNSAYNPGNSGWGNENDNNGWGNNNDNGWGNNNNNNNNNNGWGNNNDNGWGNNNNNNNGWG